MKAQISFSPNSLASKFPLRPLGDVLENMRNGLSVRQQDASGGFPITRIETISSGEIDLRKCGYAGLTYDDAAGYFLQYGDILFSHINSQSHIGKTAIYQGKERVLVHGMNLLCLRPNAGIVFPPYLIYALRHPFFRCQLPRVIKPAVNQASVTTEHLKQLLIPLPESLDEQKRIAAILDKADAIRRKRQLAIDLADQFIRSVFLDMFGDPVLNPKAWTTKELRELVTLHSGATPSRANSDFWNGGLPWVSPKDMKTRVVSSSKETVTGKALDETNLSLLPINTILIVVRGMILAHSVPVAKTNREVAINQDMKGMVCSGEIVPEFLLWTMIVSRTHLLSLVDSAAHGTKRLDSNRLLSFKIPIPNRELQNEWCALLAKHDSRSLLSSSYGRNAEFLFRSLCQRAFAGDL